MHRSFRNLLAVTAAGGLCLAGGAVFAAGSIAWPSAILVDDCVSRITANVINRFQS